MRLPSSIPSSEVPGLARLLKRGSLLLAPLAAILLVFVTWDPFHLFWSVDSPLVKGALMNDRLFQARWLLEHHERYDAFVVGSSRSKAFRTSAWARYLPKGSTPFHMGVNDESLFGVARKLTFLQREGYALRHVLLVVDARILERPINPWPHIFREYPAVSGEARAEYYKRYLVALLDPRFLYAYGVWRTTGVSLDRTRIWTEDFEYVRNTGDHIYAALDKERASDPSGYYERRASIFERPGPRLGRPVLAPEGRRLLAEIAALLRRQQTDLRVVVTPNFDQVSLAPEDLAALRTLFGADRVWDFSGMNRFTTDIHNYYEERHFVPSVADDILATLYKEPQ